MPLTTYLTSPLHLLVAVASLLLASIILNILYQLLPRPKTEPPLVFHFLPFFGSAFYYGTDPSAFYARCRARHGDVFSFVLLGRRMTVCLDTPGNDFILNGKHTDLNAEMVYGPLTTPVFGKDIIYDCPNSRLMEQKKFVKFGLSQAALESYVPLIEAEVKGYLTKTPAFLNKTKGFVSAVNAMSEITIFTASRTLQGPEVRAKITNDFAALYRDLDLGFRPINFLFPWMPLPQNKLRDEAHLKMKAIYMDLIRKRRTQLDQDGEPDMIRHLLTCVYKSGEPVPDEQIACMMITLLLAGQHSSSSAGAWLLLRLASRPDIANALYQEQLDRVGLDETSQLRPLRYSDLDNLPLLNAVVKETLRVHSSIHSIMRKLTRPLAVPTTPYVLPAGRVVVASPIATHFDEAHYPAAAEWDPYRWEKHLEVIDEDDVVDYGYGVTSKGTKSPYLPFGAGRHRCIGEKFAYLNLGTIVATLVRELTFATVDGACEVPKTDYTSLFSRPGGEGVVRWERR